jgi:hypothetical protein
MGVFDGQAVSAAITNPAFLDANADDIALGIIGFQNTTPASGSFIYNIQQAVNTLWTTTGATETIPGTTYSAPASTVSDGMTHVQAITALANKFHPSTGHTHTGSAGDAPPVAASSLASVPLRGYFIQGVDIVATGTSTDVSTELTGQTPSTSSIIEGVVVNAPYNKIIIRKAFGTELDDTFIDAQGNEVFGRLTESVGVWTLSYFTLIGATETAYSFGAATNVKWYYQELYNPLVNPPVYSELAIVPSENAAVDVVVATTSIYGKILLSSVAPSAIAATGSAGTGTGIVANADHTHEGVHSVGIFGEVSTLLGDVKLEAGDNITLDYNLGRLRISTLGAVGAQEIPVGTVNGINDTFGPLSQTPSSEDSVLVFIDDMVVKENLWALTGNSIVFDAAAIPQFGQTVYVFYVTSGIPALPPVPSGVLYCEYHTITAGEETAKALTLPAAPAEPAKVLLDMIGGSAQIYSVDFIIAGTTLSWNGLGLDGVLLENDVVRIYYYA